MTEPLDCLIIGAGFSGLCMASMLQRRGMHRFVLLEQAAELGGTWRDNHYPGAECDVPSALYSYSFDNKTDWDYQWSEQPQILSYIRSVAHRRDLERHIRCNCRVIAANYQEEAGLWQVELADGELLQARFLVSAVGQLHRPHIPDIAGLGDFGGPCFHSSRWDHNISFIGKTVGVIGNAASAVQFIPHVAEKASQLKIFQRSANWVSEKRDRPYRDWEKTLLRCFPFIKKAARLKTYLRNEMFVYPAMRGNRLMAKLIRLGCLAYLDRSIDDAELRRKLTPDYPVGAKRILVASGYYEALARDNVTLLTDTITRVDAAGVQTEAGHVACDILILGTGFVTNPFLSEIEVTGRRAKRLADHWQVGATAYLGVATNAFPNLFFLYGPNTNLGHNSILLMVEAQAKYLVQAIAAAMGGKNATIEVLRDVERRYNEALQRRLNGMVWNRIDASWYKSGGLITNNWPGSVGEYRRAMKRFDPADYLLS